MGLHARPASLIFMEARKYSCRIDAVCGNETADVKNLLALMGLGAGIGSEILFSFEGEDEEAAMAALEKVLSGM